MGGMGEAHPAAPAQAGHGSDHGRQGPRRAGQDHVSAVDVPHPDLPRRMAASRLTDTCRPGRPMTTQRAARDALHFAALFDRLIQNLRRFLGYDVQYFAADRAAAAPRPARPRRDPRHHLPRASCGRCSAATYHQVWWPPTDSVRHDDGAPAGLARGISTLPRPGHRRVPADLGRARSTPSATRTSRCTSRGSDRSSTPRACSPDPRDAARCIGYLTKYLTKQIADCHHARPTPQQCITPAGLADALRYEPCSPPVRELAPLRHPAQERPRPGMRPENCREQGLCRPEHLGYARAARPGRTYCAGI